MRNSSHRVLKQIVRLPINLDLHVKLIRPENLVDTLLGSHSAYGEFRARR